jgi:lipopolysaccharide transport system ATP-binding protein
VVDSPVTGRDLVIALGYHTIDGREILSPKVNVTFYTLMGDLMCHLESDVASDPLLTLPGRGEVLCSVPRLPLPAGRYTINLFAAAGPERLDWVRHAADVTVAEGDFFGSGQQPSPGHPAILVDHTWAVTDAGPPR